MPGLAALSGSQVGYINNYSGANPSGPNSGSSVLGGSPEQNYWYLAQTLDIPGGMVANTTYVLTYGVAIRKDISQQSNFRVQINGNYSPTGCNTCDAITSGSTASFVAGKWYYETVDYTAQAADNGLQPTIYLVNDGAISGLPVLTQMEFDLPVPEPIRHNSFWFAVRRRRPIFPGMPQSARERLIPRRVASPSRE
jgi:hypothetical protein